jgi:hypothetical protein
MEAAAQGITKKLSLPKESACKRCRFRCRRRAAEAKVSPATRQIPIQFRWQRVYARHNQPSDQNSYSKEKQHASHSQGFGSSLLTPTPLRGVLKNGTQLT